VAARAARTADAVAAGLASAGTYDEQRSEEKTKVVRREVIHVSSYFRGGVHTHYVGDHVTL
jgi:hypothetical protein